MQQTLIILKPDAIRRKLVSNLLSRFEKDFEFGWVQKRMLESPEVDVLYSQYVEKDFMPRLRGTMYSDHVIIATLWSQTLDTINEVRCRALEAREQLKDPHETNPACNLIHASDSVSAAVREVHLFFGGRR